MEFSTNKAALEENGFSIIENFYSEKERLEILSLLELETSKDYSSTKNLFAIRQVIKQIPKLKQVLFNTKFKKLISELNEGKYFLTKAIFFDKPKNSNWFVPFHQDLSISVKEKYDIDEYINWTHKKNQYGVQAPIKILEDTITIRIHLDDTNKENGALKVIPKSHLNGIIRKNSVHWNIENEHIGEVKTNGIMLMKPLLLHASNRTMNGNQRRVIHLELNKHELAKPLKWLEFDKI